MTTSPSTVLADDLQGTSLDGERCAALTHFDSRWFDDCRLGAGHREISVHIESSD